MWSEWFEHTGTTMPVHGTAIVAVKFLEQPIEPVGNPVEDFASVWWWGKQGNGPDIVAYRIRKPKGLTILEDIARNVDQTEKV